MESCKPAKVPEMEISINEAKYILFFIIFSLIVFSVNRYSSCLIAFNPINRYLQRSVYLHLFS